MRNQRRSLLIVALQACYLFSHPTTLSTFLFVGGPTSSTQRSRALQHFWPLRVPFFGIGRAPSEASRELRDLLLEADQLGEGNLERPRAEQLVEELTAAQVPFKQELLGTSSLPTPEGGLWRSSLTIGPTPKWEENRRLLAPFVQNRAGQAYDALNGKVSNYGEVLGTNVYFTAEGSFSEVDQSVRTCPKDYNVKIDRGGLVVFGIPLLSSAISGPGYLRCLYLDSDIRIFESPTNSPDDWEDAGLKVVQVREALFQRK